MHTSERGLDLIKEFEGLELEAYYCPAGVLTIGYGHTDAAGPPMVLPGMRITPERAGEILRADLGQYEAAVRAGITRTPTQAQFDAMVSLCYNIGPRAFGRSSVRRHFNAGNVRAAADSFLLWNKADGRVLKGLVRRREAERRLFLSEAPVTAPKPSPAPAGFLARLWARLRRWWRYL